MVKHVQHDIIRYPGNRRLYDKLLKGYTNHAQIKALIQRGELVQIFDFEIKRDVTQAVMLEILAAEAWRGAVFSSAVLGNWIRQLPGSVQSAASA